MEGRQAPLDDTSLEHLSEYREGRQSGRVQSAHAEVVDSVPEPRRDLATRTFEIRYSPLPSPDELERYKAINPEIPRIFIENLRNESKHRRRMEMAMLAVRVLGMLLAAGIAVLVLYIAYCAIEADQGWAAASMITAGAAIVGAFMRWGRRRSSGESERGGKQSDS